MIKVEISGQRGTGKTQKLAEYVKMELEKFHSVVYIGSSIQFSDLIERLRLLGVGFQDMNLLYLYEDVVKDEENKVELSDYICVVEDNPLISREFDGLHEYVLKKLKNLYDIDVFYKVKEDKKETISEDIFQMPLMVGEPIIPTIRGDAGPCIISSTRPCFICDQEIEDKDVFAEMGGVVLCKKCKEKLKQRIADSTSVTTFIHENKKQKEQILNLN